MARAVLAASRSDWSPEQAAQYQFELLRKLASHSGAQKVYFRRLAVEAALAARHVPQPVPQVEAASQQTSARRKNKKGKNERARARCAAIRLQAFCRMRQDRIRYSRRAGNSPAPQAGGPASMALDAAAYTAQTHPLPTTPSPTQPPDTLVTSPPADIVTDTHTPSSHADTPQPAAYPSAAHQHTHTHYTHATQPHVPHAPHHEAVGDVLPGEPNPNTLYTTVAAPMETDVHDFAIDDEELMDHYRAPWLRAQAAQATRRSPAAGRAAAPTLHDLDLATMASPASLVAMIEDVLSDEPEIS